jgi:hypothetical protein
MSNQRSIRHLGSRVAVAMTVAAAVATAILRERLDRTRANPDAGLTTAEYLMWIAIIAGIVIAVGVTISALFNGKANGLSLN